MSSPSHSTRVRNYYEHNTRQFLKRGKHGGSLNIHQALWAPGITHQAEAVSYSNRLIQEEWEDLAATFPDGRVLDLGCGVGSSLFYLAEQHINASHLIGVSISPYQIEYARSRIQRESAGVQMDFHVADFLQLPALPPIHLAYAIEAFVHAASPEAFFGEIADRLVPGGRLVLVDDVITEAGQQALSDNPRVSSLVQDYQTGWLAASLRTPAQLEEIAEGNGMFLQKEKDLTPWMALGRPRDQLIGWMFKLMGRRMLRSTYFKSLAGGYAKQQCLQAGWMAYKLLVWEKKA